VISTTQTHQDIFGVQTQAHLFRIQMHVMLQGLRIYTDASLAPDQNFTLNRNAGIGVFLISSGLHHKPLYSGYPLSSRQRQQPLHLQCRYYSQQATNCWGNFSVLTVNKLVTYINSTATMHAHPQMGC
jgi:hypothetical protein